MQAQGEPYCASDGAKFQLALESKLDVVPSVRWSSHPGCVTGHEVRDSDMCV